MPDASFPEPEMGDLYRFFFEQANASVFVIDAQTAQFIDANQEALRRLGYTRSELLKLTYYDIAGDATSIKRMLAAERAREQGQSVLKQTHRSKNGEVFPVELSARYVELDGRQVFIGVAREVSRQPAQEEHFSRAARLEAISEISSKSVSTLDVGDVLNQVVNLIHERFGYHIVNVMRVEGEELVLQASNYAEEGWVGARWNYHDSESVASWVALHGQELFLPDVTKDDRYYDNNKRKLPTKSQLAVPVKLEGEVVAVLDAHSLRADDFSQMDVMTLKTIADQLAIAIRNAELYQTERRERLLAEKLQEASATLARTIDLDDALRAILDLVVDVINCAGVVVLLLDEDVLRVAATKGHTKDAPGATYSYRDAPLLYHAMRQGQPLVIADTAKDERWVERLGNTGEVKSWLGAPLVAWNVVIGFMGISSDRTGTYGEDDVAIVRTFAQQAAVAVGNARINKAYEQNLADLRVAYDRLSQTARLAVAGEIAAGVAHQINNPLTAITAESYLLSQQVPAESSAYESVAAIQSAAQRAGTVAQQLLSLSRGLEEKNGPVDVNASLVSCVSLVRSQLGARAIQIEEDLAPDLPAIDGNAEQIEDLWLNLLLNARDAVEGREDGLIRVGSQRHTQERLIEVKIEDNGRGIPEEQIKHLFDPFFTTKGNWRTGLGLTRCHDIVRRHGGRIEVESEQGQQTTVFRVFLPVKGEGSGANSHSG